MAAAPFKANITLQGTDGYTVQYFCTVSDVNAAYYIFPDGQGQVTLPTNHGQYWTLKDIALSAAGTDTTTGSIFINGKNTGEYVVNASNVTTTQLLRQFQISPRRISAGSTLRILQNT